MLPKDQQRRSHIVTEVMSVEDLRTAEPPICTELPLDKLEMIEWCARRRLLNNYYMCMKCNQYKFLVKNPVIDGYIWSCSKCKFSTTIRIGSAFKKSHLTLRQMLIVFIGWAQDVSQPEIAMKARLKSQKTTMDWCAFCREKCTIFLKECGSQVPNPCDDPSWAEVWKITKSKLRRQSGTTKANMESYVNESYFRHRFKGNVVNEFLIELCRQYPVNN